MDPLLLPLLLAGDESGKQQIIAQLLAEELTPLIEKVIWRKLGVWQNVAAFARAREDFADLKSEIIVRLLTRLQQCHGQTTSPIGDVHAYTASLAFRCCADYFRQNFPYRHRHKNRIRYLFTHQAALHLHPNEAHEWLCGLSEWSHAQTEIFTEQQFEQVTSGTLPDALRAIPDPTFRRQTSVSQVVALLRWANVLIPLDSLVAILAHWWQVQDSTQPLPENENSYTENFLAELESRANWQQLWAEILQLPVRQRQALLLNLRVGKEQSGLLYFPASQIAGFAEIADALELPAAELLSFWNQLPLDDNQIATRLDLTRQQIINLRQAARERLHRKFGK